MPRAAHQREMVNQSDISVIVQGPLYGEHTEECLRSVRKLLPDAELILSTWEGSEVPALWPQPDVLLLNKDPGSVDYTQHYPEGFIRVFIANIRNFNRQLVSTLQGLRHASRPYALKIRTDSVLTGTGFLDVYDRYPRRGRELALFRERVVSTEAFSPQRNRATFFVQDFAYFGRNDDLQLYYNVPHVPHQDDPAMDFKRLARDYLLQAEEYLCTQAFRKVGRIAARHGFLTTPEDVQNASIFILNNFIPLTFQQFGYDLPRYPEWGPIFSRSCNTRPFDFNSLIRVSLEEWENWYNRSFKAGPPEPSQETLQKAILHKALTDFAREKGLLSNPFLFDIRVLAVHQVIHLEFRDWLDEQIEAAERAMG